MYSFVLEASIQELLDGVIFSEVTENWNRPSGLISKTLRGRLRHSDLASWSNDDSRHILQ